MTPRRSYHYRKTTVAAIRSIRRFALQGHSVRQTAAKIGWPTQTLHEWSRTHKIQFQPQPSAKFHAPAWLIPELAKQAEHQLRHTLTSLEQHRTSLSFVAVYGNCTTNGCGRSIASQDSSRVTDIVSSVRNNSPCQSASPDALANRRMYLQASGI